MAKFYKIDHAAFIKGAVARTPIGTFRGNVWTSYTWNPPEKWGAEVHGEAKLSPATLAYAKACLIAVGNHISMEESRKTLIQNEIDKIPLPVEGE